MDMPLNQAAENGLVQQGWVRSSIGSDVDHLVTAQSSLCGAWEHVL